MKKALTGLAVLLTLVLIGGSCDKDKISQMTGGLTDQTAESEVPEGWQTYTSEKHKFSFSYPEAWKIVPEVNRDDLLTMKLLLIDESQAERENELTGGMMPCEYWFTVRVEDNPENMSAKDFGVKQYLAQSREEMKAELKDYELNGVQGYTNSGPVTPPSSGNWSQVSLGPKNGKAYSFVYYAAAHPETHEKYLEEFNQILDTLEFVK
jgi:hypothetical protein